MAAFQILPFNISNAAAGEYAALTRYNNCLQLERLPDDPPASLEESIAYLQNLPPLLDMKIWAAWNADQSEIIGQGSVAVWRTEDNQHLAHFSVSVLPEYRRQGMCREFLRAIVVIAQKEKRRLLMTIINDGAPGGIALLTRLGASKSLEGHSNQLQLTDLDRDLLARWLSNGQSNQAEFELGFWDGAYPEDKLQDVAELYDLVNNQQPLDNLDVEEVHTTPELLRQTETSLFSKGDERWTYYLIDRATGKFAGCTDILWNPNRPNFLQQGMTGVFPRYRNKGLGRWLKAVMLDKVLKERSQVKFIRSHNADSNAAMLKINTALGFRPHMVESLWQVETRKVVEYLEACQD